jgi:L-2,4-diaminobutyrate decarboxylase
LAKRLLPHLMRYDAPAFQSMFNAFPAPEAALGAQLALAFNQGVTNWQVSPGGAMLEELCVEALCRLFGLADTADGTFMYAGTYANQEALYLALHRWAARQGVDLGRDGLAALPDPRRLAVMVSADAHFSLRHAVRILGLGDQALITVPVDGRRRLDAAAARDLADRLRGERDVFCIVATAGTTSTGAVDPIPPLAALASHLGAWLHIDGAYGWAYRLVAEWAPLFAGGAQADSIAWDPHKQLEVPVPNSLLFVRDRADFGRMALFSSYFNRRDEDAPNPGLKSPPSTRPLAALPLVTMIRGLGLRRLRARLRAPLAAMAALADYLESQPDFALCLRPDTGIVCFRATPAGLSDGAIDALQQTLYRRIMAGGVRTISTTTLDNRPVLRLVSVTPNATFAALRETIAALRSEIDALT